MDMALERLYPPLKYAEPYIRQGNREIDDRYEVRLATFRMGLAVAWWGAFVCAMCSSVALGVVSGLAFALIPWAIWSGLLSVIGGIIAVGASKP